MRNTRKILFALLVFMTLMVSMFAVTASAASGQTWTVAGESGLCGSNWDTTDTNNDMTYDSATDSYVKVFLNVKAGTYQFKCAKDHAWGTAYPSSNKSVTVAKDGSTVTITLKGTNVSVSVEAPTCDHKYEVTAETVTCSTAGIRTWTCSVCSNSYTENLAALGHYYEDAKCIRCDATTEVVRVYVNNAANWTVVYCYTWDTNPYISWPGEEMAKDEETGYYYYDIPKNFVNVIFSNGSAQSADLKTPTGKAVVYDNSTKAWGELPHVHSWSDATCTEAQKCECGETQGEALGHSYVKGVCSACGAADPDYVACEHVYEENVFYHPELVSATCCTTGVAVFECTLCDHYYTEETPIDPEAHGYWGDEEIVTPADCKTQTNGLKKVACANGCGTYQEVVIEYENSHTMDVQKDIQATCTEAGVYYAVCTNCGFVEEYSSEAQGHYNWYLTCGQTGTCMAEDCGVEFTVAHTINPCEGGYCMNCWTTIEALGHSYVDGKCSVCEAEDPNYVAPHVNTLVVGDTNKIVVNGETLNAYNLPIEWVAFVADEKAHYEFVGDNAALVFIYDANLNLLCGGTGKADLEAGTYLICVGNGLVGEINVAVTKSEIPVEKKWTFWLSDGSLYTVDGYNIKYNGKGNTYACVGTADVVDLAIGNNTFTVTITNNGSADARVRVDIQGTTQVGNHKVCNVSAVGGDVWTDMDWGGSIVTVPAGQSVTLTITYDAEGQYGAVTNLIFFVDSMRGDDADYSSDITVSDMAFSKVSDEPAHENKLVVGDTNKIVIDDSQDNGYGYYIELVPFAVEEAGYYALAGEGLTIWLYDSANNLISMTGAANLEVGTYYVFIAANTVATTGEYNVAVSKSAWVNAFAEGENKIYVDDSINNGADYYVAVVPFTVTEAAKYAFTSTNGLALIYDAEVNNLCGFTGAAELQPGTYYIWVSAYTQLTTGVINVTLTKTTEGGDEPAPELPAVVLGDNAVVIDGSQTNLLGKAIAWYTFTPEVAGTYQFTSDLTVYILTSQNMGDANAYVGAGGIAELEAGVQYFVLVGKDGVIGEFTVNVATYEGEQPHINTMVVGDNKYIISDALLKIGYEFLSIEITEPGTYVFTGGVPMTVFFWTVPGTLDESSPYKLNVDSITFEYLNSFEVTLSEAGVYWIGFRYDNVGDFREFDINIALKPAHEHNFVEGKCECGETDPNYVAHEHNFVEGKCECGETDPNYVAPEQPGDDTPNDTPADPQPEVKLNFFQRIWKAILEFFQKLFGKKN